MKARENPLPEKSFSRREGAIVVPTRRGGGAREGKWAETALAHVRAAPGKAPGFVVKMYGLNVAQGWEQYSTKIDGDALDIRAVMM